MSKRKKSKHNKNRNKISNKQYRKNRVSHRKNKHNNKKNYTNKTVNIIDSFEYDTPQQENKETVETLLNNINDLLENARNKELADYLFNYLLSSIDAVGEDKFVEFFANKINEVSVSEIYNMTAQVCFDSISEITYYNFNFLSRLFSMNPDIYISIEDFSAITKSSRNDNDKYRNINRRKGYKELYYQIENYEDF